MQDYSLLDGKKVYRKDFGYAPAGTGPSEWKFRLDDEGHVRDAMSRFNQAEGVPHDAMRHVYQMILERARKYGMDTSNFEKEYGSRFKASEDPKLVWPYLSDYIERKRIPVAITGTWARGGRKFRITLDHLKQMMSNFAKRKNGEINLDYDHASEMPGWARGSEIPSAGRIVGLDEPELLPSGQHLLWGVCEPTERAAGLVKNREYRWISPAINFHGEDKETGDDQGATITSVALTNRPFLEEMPMVRLSEGGYRLIDTGSVHADGADPDFSVQATQSPGAAGKEKNMKRFKVRKIKAAESSEHAGKRGVFDGDEMMGLADVEPDADDATVKNAEERFAQLLTDEGFEGQTEEQVRQTIRDGIQAKEREQKEISMRTLLSECIVGMGLDEDKAAGFLASGKVNEKDYKGAREAQRRVQKAIEEGRLLPRCGGQALRLFLSDKDLFRDLIEEGRPRLPLKPKGANRGPQSANEDFRAMVKARSEEKNIPYRQALSEVSREHPEMARAYMASTHSES